MKSKKIIWAAVVILTVLASAAILFVTAGKVKAENLKKAFAEQISLGERYLLEQRYEEAVIAFELAIEIDPKNADTYLKLSEAYVGTGNYESAVSTLEKGFENTQDSRLEEARKKYERLLGYLPFFTQMSEIMAQSDRDGVWDYMKGDEYQELAGSLDEVIAYPAGDGMYLLVYPCGHSYYGTVKDGKRSGHGIWAAYDYAEELSSYFDGEWEDDYPNGTGIDWSVDLTKPEELFCLKGSWKNGLEDGRIDAEDTYIYGGEDSVDKYFYTAKDGVPDKVEDPDYEGTERGYCIYWSDEFSVYSGVRTVFGITHAGKGLDDFRSVMQEQ